MAQAPSTPLLIPISSATSPSGGDCCTAMHNQRHDMTMSPPGCRGAMRSRSQEICSEEMMPAMVARARSRRRRPASATSLQKLFLDFPEPNGHELRVGDEQHMDPISSDRQAAVRDPSGRHCNPLLRWRSDAFGHRPTHPPGFRPRRSMLSAHGTDKPRSHREGREAARRAEQSARFSGGPVESRSRQT
jgi:hypothetical protein